MALIPQLAIAPVRAALVSQGFPARSILDDGSVDPAMLLAGVFDALEFRSKLTPPVTVRVEELSGGAPPSGFAQWIQPAVVFSGRGGKTAIAPFGVPEVSYGWIGAGGIVVGLLGIGYLLGRAVKR